MMSSESAERIHPPSPSKREQVVSQGHGPRASWLASFLGIVFFVALASLAMPLWIRSLVEMTRDLFQLASTHAPMQIWIDVITPALWLVIIALLAALLGHASAHGTWIRIGSWKMRPRSSVFQRIQSIFAGVFVAIVTMATSLAFAWPWLKNISTWSSDSLSNVVWSVLGMIAMTTLGAAITLCAASLIQRFKARNTFESSIRLTSAEAREAARESGEGRVSRRPLRHSANRSSEKRS